MREGFIVEDEEEPEERARRKQERKKRRREERDEEEAGLDEEDLDLIGEANPDFERRVPQEVNLSCQTPLDPTKAFHSLSSSA